MKKIKLSYLLLTFLVLLVAAIGIYFLIDETNNDGETDFSDTVGLSGVIDHCDEMTPQPVECRPLSANNKVTGNGVMRGCQTEVNDVTNHYDCCMNYHFLSLPNDQFVCGNHSCDLFEDGQCAYVGALIEAETTCYGSDGYVLECCPDGQIVVEGIRCEDAGSNTGGGGTSGGGGGTSGGGGLSCDGGTCIGGSNDGFTFGPDCNPPQSSCEQRNQDACGIGAQVEGGLQIPYCGGTTTGGGGTSGGGGGTSGGGGGTTTPDPLVLSVVQTCTNNIPIETLTINKNTNGVRFVITSTKQESVQQDTENIDQWEKVVGANNLSVQAPSEFTPSGNTTNQLSFVEGEEYQAVVINTDLTNTSNSVRFTVQDCDSLPSITPNPNPEGIGKCPSGRNCVFGAGGLDGANVIECNSPTNGDLYTCCGAGENFVDGEYICRDESNTGETVTVDTWKTSFNITPVCTNGQPELEFSFGRNPDGYRIHVDDDPTFPVDDAWWLGTVTAETLEKSTSDNSFTKNYNGGVTRLQVLDGQTYYFRLYTENENGYLRPDNITDPAQPIAQVTALSCDSFARNTSGDLAVSIPVSRSVEDSTDNSVIYGALVLTSLILVSLLGVFSYHYYQNKKL